MRIVVDMQGAQTESRFRGIGRYSLSLVQAMARHCGEHELILALSGLFPDTIEPIRAAFEGLLPQDKIRVWHAVGPTRESDPANATRRDIAEIVREAFIASLSGDVVLITSLFEGLGDDAVVSVGRFDTHTPSVAVMYDLIPLLSPDEHFRENPIHIGYYARKIESVKRCAALVAISESSRSEALSALPFTSERVTNISSGCDPRFASMHGDLCASAELMVRLGIDRPFVMYTGGADDRKNLHRLVQAFASLPVGLRSRHQLVLAGRMPQGHVQNLMVCAREAGLDADDLVFPGFVTDREPAALYAQCRVFVFPSLHEGFGLPPLEAMICGAPVIAANVTSLPEVIGREDAMFDPLSVPAITDKMAAVLCDEAFREDLIRYGSERVKVFSWDRSAQLALSALERVARPPLVCNRSGCVRQADTGIFKAATKRILVCKLDHMGDLVLAVPALMKLRARYPHARIDALVGSWNREAARETGIFEDVHMLDFFSKRSAISPEARQREIETLTGKLPFYDVVIDLRRQFDTRRIMLQIKGALHAGYETGDSGIDRRLGVRLPAPADVPFKTTELNRTSISLQMLRLVDALPADVNDYIRLPRFEPRARAPGKIAVFPRAGSDVKEWGDRNFSELIRLLAADARITEINAYLVSREDALPYADLHAPKLRVHIGLGYTALRDSVGENSVCVANNSFGAHLASLLGLRVVAIYGGHETVEEWAPVFGDCQVLYAPVACSPCHIGSRAECRGDFACLTAIRPDDVASVIFDGQKGKAGNGVGISLHQLQDDLLTAIAPSARSLSLAEWNGLSSSIALNLPRREGRRLFVDVSELVRQDSRTGIQRVVRSILKGLLDTPPTAFEVVPVYAGVDRPGYRAARAFTASFQARPRDAAEEDEPIDYQSGDIFLGLDLQPAIVPRQRHVLRAMRQQGVRVFFVVYDLLCANMPQYFEEGPVVAFADWLEIVAESDGAFCISGTVREDLLKWIAGRRVESRRPFIADWFHLGADIESSMPTTGVPPDASDVLDAMKARPTFLMVGTLEPRKGHSDVLEAFERLWEAGHDISLVIAGKVGWHMNAFAGRVKSHEEFRKRLFWLEGASDEYLKRIYAASHCLVAASYGEGFGLPLIEAAQHGLPIIARDIPVFREVAAEHALYFSEGGRSLEQTIKKWLTLAERKEHPKSESIAWLTWQQSVERLVDLLCRHGIQNDDLAPGAPNADSTFARFAG